MTTPDTERARELAKRLRDMAAAIRLYEGGPSAEEGTVLEAAIEIEQHEQALASRDEVVEQCAKVADRRASNLRDLNALKPQAQLRQREGEASLIAHAIRSLSVTYRGEG